MSKPTNRQQKALQMPGWHGSGELNKLSKSNWCRHLELFSPRQTLVAFYRHGPSVDSPTSTPFSWPTLSPPPPPHLAGPVPHNPSASGRQGDTGSVRFCCSTKPLELGLSDLLWQPLPSGSKSLPTATSSTTTDHCHWPALSKKQWCTSASRPNSYI